MEVILILFYFVLCLIVSAFGANKSIGFWGTFFVSLLLSPLIGLIVALLSSSSSSESEVTKHIIKGEKALKSNNVYIAIDHFNRSLNFGATPLGHYKLACCYSLLGDKQKSLSHLEKAMDLGFSDYKKIETDPPLGWLRQQPEYTQLKSKGFNTSSSEPKKDHISQLKDLADLKERNMITDEEFNQQKAKLLSS